MEEEIYPKVVAPNDQTLNEEEKIENLESFYETVFSKRGKYNDPEARLRPDGSYKKKFQELTITGAIPFVPMSVTLAEIRMKRATSEREYDLALGAVLFAWRCYISEQHSMRGTR